MWKLIFVIFLVLTTSWLLGLELFAIGYTKIQVYNTTTCSYHKTDNRQMKRSSFFHSLEMEDDWLSKLSSPNWAQSAQMQEKDSGCSVVRQFSDMTPKGATMLIQGSLVSLSFPLVGLTNKFPRSRYISDMKYNDSSTVYKTQLQLTLALFTRPNCNSH